MENDSDHTPNICQNCGKRFQDQDSLVPQVRIHLDGKPYVCYVCSMCEESFDQSSGHTRNIQHKCSHCGKGFRCKSTLTKHLRIHTGERPFVCSVCKNSFSERVSLAYHMATHFDKSPHKCPTCGRGFTVKRYLTRHLTVHTDKSRYLCSLCNKSFNQLCTFSAHTKTYSHKLQVLLKSCVNEEKCSQEISSICESRSSASEFNSSEEICLPTSNTENCSGLHSAPTPFIINIKTEHDI